MDIFEPSISFQKADDGTYKLNTLTLTPNSCYAAGTAQVGLPPGIGAVRPNQLTVVVNLTYTNADSCQFSITNVPHELAGIKVTADKEELAVFAVLGDKIVGVNSVLLSDQRIAGRYRTRAPGSGIRHA